MEAKQHNYFTIASKEEEKLLHRKAERLVFPLSKKDLEQIKIVEEKFDSEENCAGIAAPQLGISKAFMVFSTPEDENFKKFRPDWTDSMPKTIWINPSYQGIEDAGKNTDYEGCFSVPDVAGLVKRYKQIYYNAFDIDGNPVSGKCEGFLARIIQHETDHLNGVLFTDIADPDTLMSLDAYRKMRSEALGNEVG